MKILILTCMFCFAANAQQYPRWFLFQDQVTCPKKVVSILRAPSLYKDSAIAVGFKIGCDLLAKYSKVKVSGGQAFWTTEAGAHSMGAAYTEQYDSSLSAVYQSRLKVISVNTDTQSMMVLAGDSLLCVVNDDLQEMVPLKNMKQPRWIEELPNINQFYFGVGESEEYYYESSSWQRAEHNAIMSLARTIGSTVSSLQKKTTIESQDIFNETINVELNNIEIVARWRDVKKKVFYVLARIKR